MAAGKPLLAGLEGDALREPLGVEVAGSEEQHGGEQMAKVRFHGLR